MSPLSYTQLPVRHQLLIVGALLALAPRVGFGADKTHQLFDGKDLAGWRQPTGTWTVAKGVALDPADPKMFVITPGQGIHENIELNGPTRGAMSEDEMPTGPIRLQGDHGPVAYRNLRVREVELE